MPLESLLLSRDPEVIRVLRPALEKLSVDVEVCQGAGSGTEILSSEKFDAIIVDCDDLQGGLEVFETLRNECSNRSSVTFAILNGKTTAQQAFGLGASFVLQKPISVINAMRCFGAALEFMEREHRRYFRYPVEMSARLVLAAGHEVQASATNLSEGGMAVRFLGKLPKAGFSKIVFALPGRQTSLEAKAELVWVDATGRGGLRFVEMPHESREHLERWLAEQMKDAEQQQDAGSHSGRGSAKRRPQ